MSEADAKAAALRWLTQREHSRAELVGKLKAKGLDDTLVREALDGLEQSGLQSDGRFLESFVRGRFAKGHGPQRIRQELHAKGITGEGLADCLAGYDWDALLARVHEKKFGRQAPADPKEYAARVRFLSQRGFESDKIQALLRRLRQGDDLFNH